MPPPLRHRSQGNEVAVEVAEPPNPGATNLFRTVRVIARAVGPDGITLRGRPRSATDCAPDPPMSAAESVNVIAIREFLGGLLHRASPAVWRRSEVAAVDLGNLAASLGCCLFHVRHRNRNDPTPRQSHPKTPSTILMVSWHMEIGQREDHQTMG
jgi:hypothetical protein